MAGSPIADLYLHCGWPRTGTTSLQAALVRQRRSLADAGVHYPERWCRDNGAHSGLVRLLEPSAGSGESAQEAAAAFDELREYLYSHAGEKVLLSYEGFAFWLFAPDRRPLTSLFRSLHEIANLTCIWTLRRIDDWITSLYLRLVLGERTPRPLDEYFQRALARAESWTAAMCSLAHEADETVYVRYRSSGAHQAEILAPLGISHDLSGELAGRLRDRPLLNRSLTDKAATAFVHREAVAARAGVPVTGHALRRLYWTGELRFDDEQPCELFGLARRRALHERTLEAARRVGFDAYRDFFADDEVAGAAQPTRLHPDLLDDDDIERLAARLSACRADRSVSPGSPLRA